MPSTPQQATIGNPSADTLAQWNRSKNPTGVEPPKTTPDLTDDLVRQAREWQLLNAKARRGQSSSFVTSPTADMSKPPTNKKSNPFGYLDGGTTPTGPKKSGGL